MSKKQPPPNNFPEILKQYTKCAIRAQPSDLIKWSAEYFRTLANDPDAAPRGSGSNKQILLKDVGNKGNGLNAKVIETLYNQLRTSDPVHAKEAKEKWICLGLKEADFECIVKKGHFEDTFNCNKFIALVATQVDANIDSAVSTLSALIAHSGDKFPIESFKDVYQFLASICKHAKPEHVQKVICFIEAKAATNEGLVTPNMFQCTSFPKQK